MNGRNAIILLGASFAIPALAVWLVGGSTEALPGSVGLEGLLVTSISMPAWSLWPLCGLPIAALLGVAVQAVARRRAYGPYFAPAAPPPPGAGRIEEDDAQVAAQEPGEAEPPRPGPAPYDAPYHEDAVFDVIWRWYGDPSHEELLASCPACNDPLVPLANGGGLSRGLHCERCNKLRAAGEHPSDIQSKVQRTLGQRLRSGEWRAAPARIERARSAAARGRSRLPAA